MLHPKREILQKSHTFKQMWVRKYSKNNMRGTAAERQRGIGNVRSDIGEANVYN